MISGCDVVGDCGVGGCVSICLGLKKIKNKHFMRQDFDYLVGPIIFAIVLPFTF